MFSEDLTATVATCATVSDCAEPCEGEAFTTLAVLRNGREARVSVSHRLLDEMSEGRGRFETEIVREMLRILDGEEARRLHGKVPPPPEKHSVAVWEA